MPPTRTRPNERPVKRTRTNARGREVTTYEARFTQPDGTRPLWKPDWNGGRGTFARERDAQRAINEAYDYHYGGGPKVVAMGTVAAFHSTWEATGRSERTDAGNKHVIGRALGLRIEGLPLGEWLMPDLRPRHMEELVGLLFTEQGRNAGGVKFVIKALSMMFNDAKRKELVEINPTHGVTVYSTDTRAKKAKRVIRVWTRDQLLAFAMAGRPEAREQVKAEHPDLYFSGPENDYEPVLRCFTDTGLRLGEVLALDRAHFNGEHLHVPGTAHLGVVKLGDTSKKLHVRDVPLGRSFVEITQGRAVRIDTKVLYPTPRGKVWREDNFRRDVWRPAQIASGLDITPHECRHSWITHLVASGVDLADLAKMAGHRLQTLIDTYVHPVNRSDDAVREALG